MKKPTLICLDLDDTLYKERDWAFEGYALVERLLHEAGVAGSVALGERMRREVSMSFLEEAVGTPLFARALELYRFAPRQSLDGQSAREVLAALQARGFALAMITDGRSRTQRDKLRALGIEEYFPEGNVLISEETGHYKTEEWPFRRIMELNPEARHYIYVADNPAKDFYHANRLGWTTVQLLDPEGVNIHPVGAAPDAPLYSSASIQISSLSSLLSQDWGD